MKRNKIDFYLMGNFWQNSTGLPMVIWVTLKQEPIDTPWIIVQQNYSKEYTEKNMIRVDIETFEIITGIWKLKITDFDLVKKWIELNIGSLHDLWDDRISSTQFTNRVIKI